MITSGLRVRVLSSHLDFVKIPVSGGSFLTSPARFADIDLGLETMSEPCDNGHGVLLFLEGLPLINKKGGNYV